GRSSRRWSPSAGRAPVRCSPTGPSRPRAGWPAADVTSYVEPGGSWRPFWIVAGALGIFAVLDLALPGPDIPPWLWALTVVTVLGAVWVGCLSARRIWTVRIDDDGLAVGADVVALREVDAVHLAAVEGGVDAGAP